MTQLWLLNFHPTHDFVQNEALPSTYYPLYVQDTFIIWST